MYDLTDGNGFRLLHQLDVDKLLRKVRDSKDKQKETTEQGIFLYTDIKSGL